MQLLGEGTVLLLSLSVSPCRGEQGLPSLSTDGSRAQLGFSVEILSTMLDRQSRLETTEFFPGLVSEKKT